MLLWYLLRRFTEQSSCQGCEGSLAATKLLSSLHQVQEAAVNLVFKPQFLPEVATEKEKTQSDPLQAAPAICCLLTPPVFKRCFYFAVLAVSSRCRKAIRAGHPVPSSALGSPCVTFGEGSRGKPGLACLSGNPTASTLPPRLRLSRSCQLPSAFLNTA